MANPISTGRRAAGFTYLGLIILLAIMGLVAAAGIKMGTVMQRAAAEEELLEIGAQFSAALRSYAAATPKGQPTQPPTLQELLKDPRFPNPRRHLRKIFVDPVTGQAEWGIIYLAGDKGVIGVYSRSNKRPLKVANFDARFQNFENKERLSEWRFTMADGGALIAPAPLVPPVPPAATAAAPSLFGARQPAAEGQPMAPPPPAPEAPESEPAETPDDKPMEPPPDTDKEEEEDKEDEARPAPVAPPDDGRVDETRKEDPKKDEARKEEEARRDPRVPLKRPVNRR